ncbi:winged helix-turn-helix domain-containing protein [Dactylosporangium aurantiacum]|uniref:Winged helix-turn-helix domain-containing protein n=1 Tax=Dactylosporangium aurantiacum TaxID=35754 RepID=A0A9Q9IAI6_9ACTN|nr:BTAD domain-containing putative transcriptional regulator [Dactylosporangium aurantiacum]MDG6106703.1 BTAD domain-containing putative transcriptional regulator [Dactylosporangium aurantiacum]UWZ50855.1 winged helix-turn-helix domain-containing protein [Dactylosporangium aurantiacum]
MEFRILGPLEVLVTGRSVPLGGPKPRAVLATLLLDADQVVTVDRLIGGVWGEDPPPSATNALQTYLSRLRRVLGADTLRRHQRGYRVVAGAGQIDAQRFEHGVTQGREALAGGDPAAAHRTVEAALTLWRGPALMELTDDLSAQAEIARLTELRQVAAELRVEALLGLGRTDEAVAAATALVADHPLRERSRAQLMLALYRAGRQTEALATYHDARALLAGDFGLDPGVDLAALAQAILRQDRALLDGPPPARPAPHRPRTTTPGRLPTPVRRPTPGQATSRAPVDRFLGRTLEVGQVRALLREHRLITLTGPGGAGKSRLATEVCRDAGLDVRVAELAGLTDEALLEPAIAQAFGLAVSTDVAGVAAAVGDRDLVLLLDNGEHLVAALATAVPRLLHALPGLRILVTSRAPLSIGGERLHPVPPLPAATAVELFLDRAAAVAPQWTCAPAERQVVARICARLDGLPLAVELAAAQLVALSPAQILQRLDDPAALRTARRDVPDRHRSLDSAIDVTYRLLDPPQRDTFARLSVFAGTFDLEAAERVAGGAVLAPLTGLITGSLVTTLPGTSPRRYRMLQTLRQYADRRLGDDERRAVRRRHLDRAAELAATADRELRGPDARRWFRTLAAEQDDLRAALAHALGGADPGTGLRLAADLAWFWYRAGRIAEGLRWLRAGLDAAPGAADDDRARALTGVASLCYLAGDVGAGTDAVLVALRLARRAGRPTTLARASAYLTLSMALRGRVAEGVETGRQARAQAVASGADWVLAEALISIGLLAGVAGDPATGAAVLDEAIDVGTRCGFGWSAASARWIRAKQALATGAYEQAYALARRAARDLDDEDDVTGWLATTHLLAGALALTGRPEDGAVLLGAVDALGAQAGYAPLRMDPVNGPRTVQAVTSRLTPAAYRQAHARGLRLRRPDVRAYLDGL